MPDNNNQSSQANSFNPDAYIASPHQSGGFDPDAYITQASGGFDPNKYLDDGHRDIANSVLSKYHAGETDLKDDELKGLVETAYQGRAPGQGIIDWAKGMGEGIMDPSGIIQKIKGGLKTAGEAGLRFLAASHAEPEDVEEPGTVASSFAPNVMAGAYSAPLDVANVGQSLAVGAADMLDADNARRLDRIARSEKLSHDINASEKGVNDYLGADPADPLNESTRFLAQAAFPIKGAGELSPAIAKATDAAVELAPSAIKYGAPAMTAAGLHLSGLPGAGEVLTAGYGLPIAGKLKVVRGLINMAKRAAEETEPENPSMLSDFWDALSKAPNQTPVFQYIKQGVDDRITSLQKVADKLRSDNQGKIRFADDPSVHIDDLDGTDRKLREKLDQIGALQDRSEKLATAADVNKVLTYTGKLSLNTVANTAVGGAIMSGISAAQAQPQGVEQAAKEGFQAGVGLTALFAPAQAADAMKKIGSSTRPDSEGATSTQPTDQNAPPTIGVPEKGTPSADSRPQIVPAEAQQAAIDPAVEEAARDKFIEQVPPQLGGVGRHAGQRTTDAAAKRAGEQWDDLVSQYQSHLQANGLPMPTSPDELFNGVLEHQLLQPTGNVVQDVDNLAKSSQATQTINEVDDLARQDTSPERPPESKNQPIPSTQPESPAEASIPQQEDSNASANPNIRPPPPYDTIRQQAEQAKTEELKGTNRKTKQAEIERAGIEAMMKAHAEDVGEDSDAITFRTNRFGRESISGRTFDPSNDPAHAHLSERANLAPEDAQTLNFLESNMGKIVSGDHLSAPNKEQASGISRKAEQAESTATARIAGEAPYVRAPKTFIPTGFTYNIPSRTFEVNAFGVDKLLNNAKQLIPWAKSEGLDTWKSINDPGFLADWNKKAENFNNGYTATGKPIQGTEATPSKPNPDYTPHVLSQDKADLLNAMMGNISARNVARNMGDVAAKTKADKQSLAKQNSPYYDPQTGEVNRVRAMIDEDASLGKKLSEINEERKNAGLKPLERNSALLESVYETLRPENLENLKSSAAANEATLRPSGFTSDPSALVEQGLPKSHFTAAGFKRGGVVPTLRRARVA